MSFHKNKKQKNKADSNIKLTGLENVRNKKVRIFKFDGSAKIKKFYFQSGSLTKQISVILPDIRSYYRPYAYVPDKGMFNEVFFLPPARAKTDNLSKYLHGTRHALVNDQLFIFGGYFDADKVIKELKKKQ